MTAANKAIAVQYEWIKITQFFVKLAKNNFLFIYFFGVPQNFSH